MRNCFFGGAMHAVLLLQKGHGDELAADITDFYQPTSVVNTKSYAPASSGLRKRFSAILKIHLQE
jgi:hypothetical protein